MYDKKSVKSEYFRQRYKKNPDEYKQRQSEYWKRYAQKTLNKDNVTEQEIKDCMNAYYRDYRKNKKEQVKKTEDRFWENQAKKLNIESE